MNLKELIRETIDETSLVDPGEIAEAVAARLHARDLRDAVDVMLRDYVRVFLHSYRPPVPDEIVPSGRSQKGELIRAGLWRATLGMRVHVGEQTWRLLGECSVADLKFAAEQRRDKARENEARSRIFDGIAALVESHDVATVADLPDDVLKDAVGGLR